MEIRNTLGRLLPTRQQYRTKKSSPKVPVKFPFYLIERHFLLEQTQIK
ncbi:hypothetical protein [Peribacillus simplex]